jgi:hypothetical protein
MSSVIKHIGLIYTCAKKVRNPARAYSKYFSNKLLFISQRRTGATFLHIGKPDLVRGPVQLMWIATTEY